MLAAAVMYDLDRLRTPGRLRILVLHFAQAACKKPIAKW
jgi:hypothetical protein